MVNEIVRRQTSVSNLFASEDLIQPVSVVPLDSPFTPDNRRFIFYKISVGDSGDNMLKFSNNGVSCNGFMNEKGTKFYIYAGIDGNTSVCVLVCSEGPLSGQVLRIINGQISYRKSEVDFFSSTFNFSDVGQDVLFEFYRQTISSNNVLYSFRLRHQPSAVLGFTDDGVAVTTYSYKSDNSLLMRVQADANN